MTTEQLNQICAAISEGRYSWACVLILRFHGYNPLHYIPYTTYNRIVKGSEKPTVSSTGSPTASTAPTVSTPQVSMSSMASGRHLPPPPRRAPQTR